MLGVVCLVVRCRCRCKSGLDAHAPALRVLWPAFLFNFPSFLENDYSILRMFFFLSKLIQFSMAPSFPFFTLHLTVSHFAVQFTQIPFVTIYSYFHFFVDFCSLYLAQEASIHQLTSSSHLSTNCAKFAGPHRADVVAMWQWWRHGVVASKRRGAVARHHPSPFSFLSFYLF